MLGRDDEQLVIGIHVATLCCEKMFMSKREAVQHGDQVANGACREGHSDSTT